MKRKIAPSYCRSLWSAEDRSHIAKMEAQGKADQVTMTEFSITVWYTKEFADIEEDVDGYIAQCFAELNAAFKNSKVSIVCISVTSYQIPSIRFRPVRGT